MPPSPHPLASAPLSVLLIAQNYWADDVAEAAAGWLDYLRGLGRAFEVILLDDGANAAAADQVAVRFLEIRVVHHSRAQGLGRSLRAGLRWPSTRWFSTACATISIAPPTWASCWSRS